MTLLPDFQLPTTRGGRAGTMELSQRREMVLGLLHPLPCRICASLRAEFYRQEPSLLERNASIRIVPVGHGEWDSPLTCLVDEGGVMAAQLAQVLKVAPGQAFVAIADRFTKVYAVKPVHGADPSALARDVVDWVDFIQTQCPECGAPVW